MQQTPGQAASASVPGRTARIRRWSRTLCYALPVVLLLMVTLPHLGQGDWRGDTGWYAALGLSGWRDGHLWTLHSGDGLPYFNKPPLALWIHGLALHAVSFLGESMHGPGGLVLARLPTILAAMLIVVATVGTARQFVNRQRAMTAGIVLALSMELFRRCREISLDMWQLAFLAGAVWLVAIAARTGKARWILAAGVPVGLALMCKPLMAILALPMLGAWLVLIGRGRLAAWLTGTVLVATIVAAPWHVSMWMIHGTEFTGQYFGAEVAKRAAGESVGGQRGQAWTFYLAQIGAGYWPWLLCAAFGLADALRRPRRSARFALAMLGLICFAGWLILLTIFPDRRDRYAVPLYPGLALIAGPWLLDFLRARSAPVVHATRRFGVPVAAAIGIALAITPIRVQRAPDPQWADFESWCRSKSNPEFYDGAFAGAPAARVYLITRRWPIATFDRHGKALASPPPGSFIAYHRRGGRAPGKGESIAFTSGDVTVTELHGSWNPIDAPDPGE